MKFSDNLIANIARVLQIGILTGTDIVDHLRSFSVEEADGELSLTDDSLKRVEREIQSMLNTVTQNGESLKNEEGTDFTEN